MYGDNTAALRGELATLLQITRNQQVLDTLTPDDLEADPVDRRPDLVLLDIGLPDMDGWHLLEALREQPTLTDKEPLVLVMTAYADAANRLIGKLQRVDGYLTKPCTVQEIRSAVVSVLQLLDTANLSDPRA